MRRLQQDLDRHRRLPLAPGPAFAGLANEQGNLTRGRIDFAAISVDPTTGTLLLRAVYSNSDRSIVPGLFARVRVPVGRQANALMVPETAWISIRSGATS